MVGSSPVRLHNQEDLRFGAVLFDDIESPSSGWMSIEGTQVKRIDDIHQMPSDVIFWTNIAYGPFFSGAGRTRSNLRHAEYLVCKPTEILGEWGYPENTPQTFTPVLMSVMFSRIARLTFGIASKCNPQLRMSEFFTNTTLQGDVGIFLPEAEFPEDEAVETCTANKGFVRFTVTNGVRGPKGGAMIKLRPPRLSYARKLLNGMTPVGPFEFINPQEASGGRRNLAAWLCSQPRPFVAEIAVDDGDPDSASMYGYGNTTDRKKVMRTWVAAPELKALLTIYKKISVRSVWMGKDYKKLSDTLPDPIMKFLNAKISFGSWSAGVVAETIWRAACAGDIRRKMPGEPRANTSWRGAWLFAEDKVEGYQAAKSLYDFGHVVTMYGPGWLNSVVASENVEDLIRDSLTCGLIPPMVDVPDNMMRKDESFVWGGNEDALTLVDCILKKRQQLAWNTDEVRVLPPGKERNDLKQKIMDGLNKGVL